MTNNRSANKIGPTTKTHTRKHAGLKRNNNDIPSVNRKKNRLDQPLAQIDYSGKYSDDHMDSVSEEDDEVEDFVPGEGSVYDNLLKKLGSGNSNVADALKRRQREEAGEETDSDSESDENARDEAGSGDNSNTPKGSGLNNDVKLSEEFGADDYALSETDDESDRGVDDESVSEASMSSSNFISHLGYKLASSEAESLLKRKWSYTWKMPALNMSNCNWRGTGECFIQDKDMGLYAHYDMKPRLYKHWLELYQSSGGSEFHNSKQMSFFSICNNYIDILHHNKKPFYRKGLGEDSSIMDAYLVHCLNHIFKSRDLMRRNEKKLARQEESAEVNGVDGDDCLDRGFTRPKVLILLPLAGIARRVVKRLIQLTPPKLKGNVEDFERFSEEFGSGRSKDMDEDDPEIPKSKTSSKPSDFQALIGRDNANDDFMIGFKFTNRGIKLYSDFYTSDVIIASPIGLIPKIEHADKDKEKDKEKDKAKDVDYLSSIEVLIVDHADIMLMQNWSHVNKVVENLNSIPSRQHGTDIMRIRPWYLDGQAQFYRQTIILSSHSNPDINALFNHHCLNYHGKVKLECKFKGVLPKILISAQQIYERFDAQSVKEADDARLKYFCEKVFPKIKNSDQEGVMIFFSSYFEFVRVRNYLKSQSASLCLFGEYIRRNDISGVRGQFFRGEKKIMLYTERAHFYYRYKIRGVQNLIIYSLPERKEFYPEIVNFLDKSDSMTCTVLFSHLDYLRLERVVGSAHAKRMVGSEKGVFIFA